MLSVNIHKELESFTLNVSFETGGELMALLGPSGCGKSMTLKCIAGLETPDRGRIVLGERVLFDSAKKIDLPPQKRRVGYLFQDCALFPHMTVRENLLAAARRLPREKRAAAVEEKLRAFRATGLDALYPRQLTKEQCRRVALARVFLGDPECVLLDEPFSVLDSHLRWQTELELGELLRPYQGDALLATHDRGETYRLCGSVCTLAEGKSEEKVSVRTLMEIPNTVNTALISGCENFSRVKRVDASHVKCVDWGMTLETAQPVTNICTYAGVRAHCLRIARSGEPNRFDARVVRVIEDTFSTVLMLAPEGGAALLRMELPKKEWAAMRSPPVVLLGVAPEDVMILSGEL